MIHSIRIYQVAPQNIPVFIAAIRNGGLWREFSRQLRLGLIATDFLRSSTLPSAFLSIDSWISEQAYRAAKYSAAHSAFGRLLRKLTVFNLDLGTHSFPP